MWLRAAVAAPEAVAEVGDDGVCPPPDGVEGLRASRQPSAATEIKRPSPRFPNRGIWAAAQLARWPMMLIEEIAKSQITGQQGCLRR